MQLQAGNGVIAQSDLIVKNSFGGLGVAIGRNIFPTRVKEKVGCQQCGSREWMDAELIHPTGEQAHTIRYRRLVQKRWEKRVSGGMSRRCVRAPVGLSLYNILVS